jgi:hypothetical protein
MGIVIYRSKVKRVIRDEAEILSLNDIDSFILEALNYFSKDYPQVKAADIAGDGSYQYDVPSDWVDEISQLKSVEYPAGERPPVYLEPDNDYLIYKSTSGEKLLLVNHTPATGETLRLTYTIPYVEDTIDNIPAPKQDGLVLLTGVLCCEALARHYAQSQDSSIDADVADHQNRSNIYAQRAKELQKRYNDFMGKQKGPGAASGTREWDVNYPWGGDHLTHPRRQR